MSSVATVQLEGHLTPGQLATALAGVHKDATAVVLDCRPMDSYDFSARKAFVDWNEQHRGRIRRVAIVTANPLWPLVISAMALASKQNMKAFRSAEDAGHWASEG